MPITVVEVPLISGVDEQIDRRLLPFGRLRRGEDCVIETDGRISKRHGWAALTMTELDGTSMASIKPRRLACLGAEKVLFCSDTIYSYSDEAAKWAPKDYAPPNPCSRVSESGVRQTPGVHIYEGACAHNAGFTIVAWSEGGAKFGVKVIEESTGAVLHQRLVSGACEQPRCWASGDYLYAGYIYKVGSPYKLNVYRFNTTAPQTGPVAGGVTQIVTTVDITALCWDVAAGGDTGAEIAVAWGDSGANKRAVATYSEALVQQNSHAAGSVSPVAICVYAMGSSNVYVATWEATNGLVGHVYPANLASVSSVTLDSSTSTSPAPVVMSYYDATHVWVYWSEVYTPTGMTATQPRIERRTLSSTATAGTAEYRYGVKVASKPFAYDSVQYLWGAYDDDSGESLQKFYVLLNMDQDPPQPMARVRYADARGFAYTQAANECAVNSIPTAYRWVWVAPRTYTGRTDIADPETGLDIFRWTLTCDSRTANWMEHAELGSLCLSGGYPWLYDGHYCAELGFLQYPEPIEPATTGAGNVNGSVQYCATYAWVDERGNAQESAPSAAVTLAATNNAVMVRVPPLQMTRLDHTTANGAPAAVNLYRTTASGSVFYFVGSSRNTPGSTPVGVTDDLTDASLTERPALYTMADEAIHQAPPGCDDCCVHGERLWLLCGDRVYHSHRRVPSEMPTFDAAMVKQLPEVGTAIASLDAWLVVFSPTAIYVTQGDGPSRNGQGQYPEFERLTTETGCIEQRSVVKCPRGLVFQSERGIELLPRGGGPLQYLSGAVREQLVSYPYITGAVLDAAHSQVLFLVTNSWATYNSGRVLVWNYRVNQWTVWTTPSLAYLSADLWDDWPVILQTDYGSGTGAVYQMSDTSYADPSSARVSITLETGDIRPAGILRYSRVQGIQLLGEYRSSYAQTVTVGVAYDGSDSFSESHVLNVTGVTGREAKLEVIPVYQKFESVRLQIVDTGATADEGIAWNAVALEVKPKRGMPRLQSSLRV